MKRKITFFPNCFKKTKMLKETECFINRRLRFLIQNQNIDRFYNKHFKFHHLRATILKHFVYKTCALLNLTFSTFAKATALFDLIISKYPINSQMLVPLAGICLGLIIKFNETKIISYQDLFILNGYDQVKTKFILKIEKKILQNTQFKINLKTPFDFLEMFILLEKSQNNFKNKESANHSLHQRFKMVFKIYCVASLNFRLYKISGYAFAVVVLMIVKDIFGWDFQFFKISKLASLLPKKKLKILCADLFKFVQSNLDFINFRRQNKTTNLFKNITNL